MKKTKLLSLIALAVVPAGIVYAVMDDDGSRQNDRGGFAAGPGGGRDGDRFPGGPGGMDAQPGMGGGQQGGPPPSMGTPASTAEAKKAGAAATKRYPGTIERVMKLADGSFVVHVITKSGEQHVAVSKAYKVTGAAQGGPGMRGDHGMQGKNGSTTAPPTEQRAS